MKKGYYWIKFNGEKTIGYFDGSEKYGYPRQIVGSDEIFTERAVKIIREVK